MAARAAQAGRDHGNTVIADCYLVGVSTRRIGKVVKQLVIHALSKSQVSVTAPNLDEHIGQFPHLSLGDAGPLGFVAADALTMRVREGVRVINAVVLIATGVNADGRRKVFGMCVATRVTGTASSPTLSPAASAGFASSPGTRTRAWWKRSQRTCLERPGNAVALTTTRT